LVIASLRRLSLLSAIKWSFRLAGATEPAVNAGPAMSRSVSTEVGRDLAPLVVTPSSLPYRIDSSSVLTGFGLLATSGAFVSVGLVGNKIDIPLFPFVAGEFTYHGSFWANYSDLQEVLALAQQGKIQHSIKRIWFEDINENLEMLRRGDIIGRAVIVFDVKVNFSDGKEAKDATAPGRGASQAGSSATQG